MIITFEMWYGQVKQVIYSKPHQPQHHFIRSKTHALRSPQPIHKQQNPKRNHLTLPLEGSWMLHCHLLNVWLSRLYSIKFGRKNHFLFKLLTSSFIHAFLFTTEMFVSKTNLCWKWLPVPIPEKMEKKLAFTLKLSGTPIPLHWRWHMERARGWDSNSGIIVPPAGKPENKEKNEFWNLITELNNKSTIRQ